MERKKKTNDISRPFRYLCFPSACCCFAFHLRFPKSFIKRVFFEKSLRNFYFNFIQSHVLSLISKSLLCELHPEMCDSSSHPLRQALQEVIVNLMSPELSVRQLAEQQVQALQVTDGKFRINFLVITNIETILGIQSSRSVFNWDFLQITIVQPKMRKGIV